MNRVVPALVALLICLGIGQAETQMPFGDETLRYTVSWPSGLSLGEGEARATRVKAPDGGNGQWEFDLKLDAAIPGFQVSDHYHSVASPDLCSLEFEKELSHGKRTARERTTFDQGKSVATRETLGGGGKSELSIPACAKDALTFLYYIRSELARGRVPPAQTILFGASYSARVQYSGRQALRLQDGVVEADRMAVSIKGKASDVTFETFFTTDTARRPVLIRVPLEMGTFTMQLVE